MIKFKMLTLLLAIFLLGGCSSLHEKNIEENNTIDVVEVESNKDPFEPFNRVMYSFNNQLDRFILKPIATVYKNYLPEPVQEGTANFFDNLTEPRNLVNNLLQGKFDRAGVNSGRFVLNSTIGILGIFDVASHLDIPEYREDFGQTLGVWGTPSGPYLVLPFLGPRNLRHAAGIIPDAFLYPPTHLDDNSIRLGLLGVNTIDTRAGFLSADDLLALQLDPYVFIRETYRQKREAAIVDNVTVDAGSEDEFED